MSGKRYTDQFKIEAVRQVTERGHRVFVAMDESPGALQTDPMTTRHPMRTNAREKKITPSSGNVFTDLGFDDAEAQVLALRADLMAQLEKQIKARKMTQVNAAKLLGVSQGRISDLTRGKVEKFSLDMLVQFAARLGKPAKIELAA